MITTTIDRDAKESRKYFFFADVEGEVRKVTQINSSFESKDGKMIESSQLEIALDDENEERFFLLDRDLSHAEKLEKGHIYTFKVRIDVEEGFKGRTKIFVQSFKKKRGS